MADQRDPNGSGDVTVPEPNGNQQSAVSRVTNLPLFSSACEAVSSAYCSTKDSLPLLKGVMDAAESGARTLGAAATTGSKPLFDMIEPQLTTVNEFALKGLEKMEEKLPILHQPADQVMSNTVGLMYHSVTGAKDMVMGAVMSGVEMTHGVVSSGISTIMDTRMGQMVSSGMGLALGQTQGRVEQHLPVTETELAAVAEPAPTEATASSEAPPSYFVRLGKLTAAVQERALQHSLLRARNARDATYAAVAQISSILDLVERTRNTLPSAISEQSSAASEQLQQRWTEWKQTLAGAGQTQPESDGTQDESEQLEWRALSMVRGLSKQLRSACSGVVTSAQGLPDAVQGHLTNARRSAEDLHSSLWSARNLTPVILEHSRHQLTQVQPSLDSVVEYLLNNIPLNWLVGPFAPQITEKALGDVAAEQRGPNN